MADIAAENEKNQAGNVSGEGIFSQGRLHGALAHRLAVDILKGHYKPGDILPHQADSVESLNSTRTPYREAIRILAAKGLVESRPKRGTQVCERSRWNLLDPEVMGWMFETTPTDAFIKGLFELRLINEPAAAELAAERRTPEQLSQMHVALMIMKEETLHSERGRVADLEFHKQLLLGTQNELLISLNSSIGSAIGWSTKFKSSDPIGSRDSWPDHLRVYEAIADSDSRAARFSMEALVRMALEDTRRSQGWKTASLSLEAKTAAGLFI